jgi:hypothetical protein
MYLLRKAIWPLRRSIVRHILHGQHWSLIDQDHSPPVLIQNGPVDDCSPERAFGVDVVCIKDDDAVVNVYAVIMADVAGLPGEWRGLNRPSDVRALSAAWSGRCINGTEPDLS